MASLRVRLRSPGSEPFRSLKSDGQEPGEKSSEVSFFQAFLREKKFVGILLVCLILISAFESQSLPDSLSQEPIFLTQDNSDGDEDMKVAPKPANASLAPSKGWHSPCPEDSTVLRLLFPHVNKAGGRSLESTFDESFVSDSTQFRFISRLPRSTRFSFEMVDGHHYYDWIKQTKRPSRIDAKGKADQICQKWIYIAREPMSRTLSAFYTMTGREVKDSDYPKDGNSIKHHKHHFFCEPGSIAAIHMRDQKFSFEDFARLPKAERDKCNMYNANLHVKYLASQYVAPENQHRRRSLLELAKSRLEEIPWVGILEKFEESMRLFSYTFGADLVRYTPISNANSYEKNVSSQARSVLREMNELDIELYEYAYQLFTQRWMAMQSDMDNENYNPLKFSCPSNHQCWDKESESPSWNRRCMSKSMIEDTDQEEKLPTSCSKEEVRYVQRSIDEIPLGQRKGRILCAPIGGCYRSSNRPSWNSAHHLLNNRCLMKFLILGTRKGGSSSLYQYVAQHPSVRGVKLDAGPQAGELFFFRGKKEQHFVTMNSGKTIRKAYNDLFLSELARLHPNVPQAGMSIDPTFHITGESSVGNGPSCVAPDAIKRACGRGVKLVYLVRNPIERMISQYKMRDRLRSQTRLKDQTLESRIQDDLAQFLKKEPNSKNWWTKSSVTNHGIPCLFSNDYLNSVWASLYVVHLSRWLKHFERRNLLVIKSEDFFERPKATVKKTLEFLNLDPSEVNLEKVVAQVYNANTAAPRQSTNSTESKYKNQISLKLRQRLQSVYKPYNEALTASFGIDTTDWI